MYVKCDEPALSRDQVHLMGDSRPWNARSYRGSEATSPKISRVVVGAGDREPFESRAS